MTINYENGIKKIADTYDKSGGYALLWNRIKSSLEKEYGEDYFKIIYETVDTFLRENRVFGLSNSQVKDLAEKCVKLDKERRI